MYKNIFYLFLPLILVACGTNDPDQKSITYEVHSPKDVTPTISEDCYTYNLGSEYERIILTFAPECRPSISVVNSNNWISTDVIGGNILKIDIEELQEVEGDNERSGSIEIKVSADEYKDLVLTIIVKQSGMTYEQLLAKEQSAILYFLKDKITEDWPGENGIKIGNDAPFYRLADSGVYMQVLSSGEGRFSIGDKVYFRFERGNLINYMHTENLELSGNWNDISTETTFFIFDGDDIMTLQWGEAIQLPLKYEIEAGAEINLLVPSAKGFKSETGYVVPYLYHVRYFKSII